MHQKLISGLIAFGIVACSDGNENANGESPAARANSSVAARDTTSGVAPAPSPIALAIGTTVRATIQQTISSRSNHVGDRVRAIVSFNVMDGHGHVVIPGGSSVTLAIAELRGAITLDLVSMIVRDSTYAPAASVGPVAHTLAPGADAASASHEIIATPGTPITIKLTQAIKITAN